MVWYSHLFQKFPVCCDIFYTLPRFVPNYFFLKIYMLIHLFLVALGLVAARGLSLVVASGLLTAVPSLIVASLDEQGLQAHGLQ